MTNEQLTIENEKLKTALNAALRACYALNSTSELDANDDFNLAAEFCDEVCDD